MLESDVRDDLDGGEIQARGIRDGGIGFPGDTDQPEYGDGQPEACGALRIGHIHEKMTNSDARSIVEPVSEDQRHGDAAS